MGFVLETTSYQLGQLKNPKLKPKVERFLKIHIPDAISPKVRTNLENNQQVSSFLKCMQTLKTPKQYTFCVQKHVKY